MAQITLAENSAVVPAQPTGAAAIFVAGTGATDQLKFVDSANNTRVVLDNNNTVASIANKSFTTPTIAGAALSGTLSGTPTFSGACIFSAVPQFSTATEVTSGTYTSGSAYTSGGLSVTKSLQAKRLVVPINTIAVNTALAFDLSNGDNWLIGAAGVPGALTAATTITFSNQLVGSTTEFSFQQGASSYNVIFTIAGYTFYQNGKTAGVATANPVLLAADMTLSQFYTCRVKWLSATTAMVSLLKS